MQPLFQEVDAIAKPRFDRGDKRQQGPRVNQRIRVPEVRVIGPEGENFGVISTQEAKRIASERNLDLVEVNPKGQPPVCRIMDYGRYKYEEKKKQSEARKRQSQVAIKEIKLRPKTDDHDVEFKTKHVRRFLDDGDKVKITVRFRGREITHPETARRQIETIVDNVSDIAAVEQSARMDGRTMTALLAPRQHQAQGGKTGTGSTKEAKAEGDAGRE